MNRAENGVSGQNLQALLQVGLRAHQAGQLPGAEAAYRKILNADPEHPEALGLLGAIALARSHHEAAVELISAAIAVKPDFTEAYINLGTALMAMARFEEALASIEQALTLDPNSAEAHSNKGMTLIKLDRTDEAVASYRRAIEIRPDYAEAHTNLGNALKETGRLDDAAASHRKVIALNPDYAEAHNNLGGVLMAQKRPDEAVTHYRKAASLRPELFEAHTNLGVALKETGRLDDAIASHEKAIALNPDYANAHTNLGNALKEAGRLEDAAASHEKAIRLNPDLAEAHNNLGAALLKLGKPGEAVASYHKAIALNPDYADAHNNLGNAFNELGRLDEAVASHEKAIRLEPVLAEAHNNLGAVLLDLGKLDDAVASYRKALVIKPDYAEAHSNLGIALQRLGKLDEAVASYRKALVIKPDYPETHYNLGLLQLLMGDYINGWEGYSWRWGVDKNTETYRKLDKPIWEGEPIEGKRLLVWTDQGIGDQIFFASIVPDLIERGIDVFLESDDRLAPLFSRSFPGATCIGSNDPAAAALEREIDFHISMAELGRLFRRKIELFPIPAPYLVAEPERSALFRKRYKEQAPGPLVGIAWTSNSPVFDKNNMFALSDLHPLLELPGVTFVDVQYGDTIQERQAFSEETGIHILHDDDVDQLVDLDTFASQLAALDLVIGIDNSLPQISSALGVPTWDFLRTNPYWCWGLDREDSYWYPGMRLFRQQQRGEWDRVIQRAARELAESFPPKV